MVLFPETAPETEYQFRVTIQWLHTQETPTIGEPIATTQVEYQIFEDDREDAISYGDITNQPSSFLSTVPTDTTSNQKVYALWNNNLRTPTQNSSLNCSLESLPLHQ
jgi:hypothetical protein